MDHRHIIGCWNIGYLIISSSESLWSSWLPFALAVKVTQEMRQTMKIEPTFERISLQFHAIEIGLLCHMSGESIWEILTSHNIIRLPNDIKGGFTFALISYPVDETFSNLTWGLFSIISVFDLKQAKSEIPRLYAIFQLKL